LARIFTLSELQYPNTVGPISSPPGIGICKGGNIERDWGGLGQPVVLVAVDSTELSSKSLSPGRNMLFASKIIFNEEEETHTHSSFLKDLLCKSRAQLKGFRK